MKKINFRISFGRKLSDNSEDSKADQIKEVKNRGDFLYLFKKYDKDKDDYLSYIELRELLKDALSTKFSEKFPDHILNQVDGDDDGKINFDEFYQVARQYKDIQGAVNTVKRAGRFIVRSMVLSDDVILKPKPSVSTAEQGTLIHPKPYEHEIKFCPPPLTMIFFTLLEIGIFIYDALYKDDDVDANTSPYFFEPMLMYTPKKQNEYWRLISYMLIHSHDAIEHIIMNTIVQIFLGISLELVHGWWRVSLIYLSGVLAGSLGTSFCNPNTELIGASGGVYALIVANIASVILNGKEMKNPIPQLIGFLVFCGIDVGIHVYRKHLNPNDGISASAHLFGGLTGLVFGIVVLKNLRVEIWQKVLWWISIFIYLVFMMVGLSVHVFCQDYFMDKNSTNILVYARNYLPTMLDKIHVNKW